MKEYIIGVFIAMLPLQMIAQQESQAKVVLDKTAETFRNAGGVKAGFTVKSITGHTIEGTVTGVIRLKGEKFILETSNMTTWFDGETQWSYIAKNDEVNISNPTQEELQQINPYTFLYLYLQGFSYKLGTQKAFQGKNIWEVILTANSNKQELENVTLYVAKDTYQPLYILLRQRGQETYSEIIVTSYQTRQNYADNIFSFDSKQHPTAEIIDLR